MGNKKPEQKNAPVALEDDVLGMVSGGTLSTDVPQQTYVLLNDIYMGSFESGETEGENSLNEMISALGGESAMHSR